MKVRVCPKLDCNLPLQKGWKFCPNCGQYIKECYPRYEELVTTLPQESKK